MIPINNMKKLPILIVFFIITVLLLSEFLLPLIGQNESNTVPLTTSNLTSHFSYQKKDIHMDTLTPVMNPTPRPHEMTINTGGSYSSEPAPMGIADYGVSSTGFLGTGLFGSGYCYYTPSFIGTINLNNLQTNNSGGSPEVTFQLNVVLYFIDGGKNYAYWIQDVLWLNTATHFVMFEDNIWNLSAPSSPLYQSSISGNGAIASSSSGSYYYDFAESSLPGDQATLNYPASASLMVNSTISSSGTPSVSFMYNDSFGWVTYDRVVFPFATAMTSDDGFVVDGNTATPSGNFYDAELILGGPGGGSSTQVIRSNLNLTLQYWNGHNFQIVPGAFNYGSDTAETSSNIISNSYYYNSNGSIFEQLTAGSGSLGMMYNPSDVSTLNINTENPFLSGTLYINGSPTHFVRGDVSLTLFPGQYNAAIYVENTLYYKQNITLIAGESLALNWYENLITFTETGLPNNAIWWVNFSHQSFDAVNGQVIQFYASNGTHEYTIATSNKDYTGNPVTSNYTAEGGITFVNVKYSPVLYNIRFKENGLAEGILWTISYGITSNSSTSNSVNFYEMNGTYDFVASNLSAYYTENYTISVLVYGRNPLITVYYNHYAYITGTVSPYSAIVSIDGKQVAVNNNGQFNVSVIAGKYSIVVVNMGYTTYKTNIYLVSGQVENLQISLSKLGNDSFIGVLAIGGIAAVVTVGGLFFIRKRSK